MRLFTILHVTLPVIAVLLGSCSTGTPTEYAALALLDRQQVTDWTSRQKTQQIVHLTDLINSPELNNFVKEAITANPSLQQTLLTLKILQAEHRMTAADRLPQATLDAAAEKENGEDVGYSGSITVSWEVDLWQQLADTDLAAAKDVAEQQALLQSAQDTLAAEVMVTWLGLIYDQRAIEIEQRRLDNLQQNERYILQRYRSGLNTLEDLDTARSSAASSRSALEEYTENLARQQRNLKTILGRNGSKVITTTAIYPVVVPPLADLPEQTLQRRPDLQAAYFAIEAAELRTSVAYKDMLPSLNLEAAVKDIGTTPHSLLFSDPVWTLLSQLTAPLFQGGKLEAAAEIAELKTAQNYQAYRETLLLAVKEVENALSQEHSLTSRKDHISTALTSARNSQARYQESYRAGLVSILDLLIVQKQTFDLEAQLDTLTYELLVNRVELGLALGIGASL